MSQTGGGERAYKTRLGKERSARQSGHSITSPQNVIVIPAYAENGLPGTAVAVFVTPTGTIGQGTAETGPNVP